MKKRFFIIVDVDTTRNHSAKAKSYNFCSEAEIDVLRDAVPNRGYMVIVGGMDCERQIYWSQAGDLNNYNLAVVTAHELGHILGEEFRLRRTISDVRNQKRTLVSPNPRDEDSMVEGEQEAWDLAKIMFSMKAYRKRALKTYIDFSWNRLFESENL